MSSAQEIAEPRTDPGLVARARAGDMEAFTELVMQHQRRIHALAYRLTGSASEAEDLAQEAFLRAWRQLPGFRGDSTFATWLCRITVNLGLNWRARRELRGDTAPRSQALPEEATPAAHPATDRVEEALLRLPAEQRAAIVLTVYEGMNHAEAAHVLQCAESTVSWRVWCARRSLRHWLADLAPGTTRRRIP